MPPNGCGEPEMLNRIARSRWRATLLTLRTLIICTPIYVIHKSKTMIWLPVRELEAEKTRRESCKTLQLTISTFFSLALFPPNRRDLPTDTHAADSDEQSSNPQLLHEGFVHLFFESNATRTSRKFILIIFDLSATHKRSRRSPSCVQLLAEKRTFPPIA